MIVDSCHRRLSSSFEVPETETGTHSSASADEGETTEGGGRGLGSNDGISTRILVDDDDVDGELDSDLKASPASVGGEKALDGIEVEGGSTETAKIVAGRGGVQENSDSVPRGKGRGPKDDLDNARDDGEAYPNSRQQARSRVRNKKLVRRGSTQAHDHGIGGDGRKHASNRSEFDLQDRGDIINNCSSTELILGRPDPTSVHWKFSRRLLQT